MQLPLARWSVHNADGWYDPRGQEPITGGIPHDDSARKGYLFCLRLYNRVGISQVEYMKR